MITATACHYLWVAKASDPGYDIPRPSQYLVSHTLRTLYAVRHASTVGPRLGGRTRLSKPVSTVRNFRSALYLILANGAPSLNLVLAAEHTPILERLVAFDVTLHFSRTLRPSTVTPH